MKKLYNLIAANSLYIIWIIAVLGTVGSLYISDILLYAPCVLCWYQRIALYPLVTIIAVGIIKKDKNVTAYAMPLAVIGSLIAFYQILLQAGVILEGLVKCTGGVSCAEKYVTLLGFITIPMLSFMSFATIIILMIIHKKFIKHHEQRN